MALLSYITIILSTYIVSGCFRLVVVVVCATMFSFVQVCLVSMHGVLHPSGNPFKCHEEVLSLHPTIPPNILCGCSEGLDAFRVFLNKAWIRAGG